MNNSVCSHAINMDTNSKQNIVFVSTRQLVKPQTTHGCLVAFVVLVNDGGTFKETATWLWRSNFKITTTECLVAFRLVCGGAPKVCQWLYMYHLDPQTSYWIDDPVHICSLGFEKRLDDSEDLYKSQLQIQDMVWCLETLVLVDLRQKEQVECQTRVGEVMSLMQKVRDQHHPCRDLMVVGSCQKQHPQKNSNHPLAHPLVQLADVAANVRLTRRTFLLVWRALAPPLACIMSFECGWSWWSTMNLESVDIWNSSKAASWVIMTHFCAQLHLVLHWSHRTHTQGTNMTSKCIPFQLTYAVAALFVKSVQVDFQINIISGGVPVWLSERQMAWFFKCLVSRDCMWLRNWQTRSINGTTMWNIWNCLLWIVWRHWCNIFDFLRVSVNNIRKCINCVVTNNWGWTCGNCWLFMWAQWIRIKRCRIPIRLIQSIGGIICMYSSDVSLHDRWPWAACSKQWIKPLLKLVRRKTTTWCGFGHMLGPWTWQEFVHWCTNWTSSQWTTWTIWTRRTVTSNDSETSTWMNWITDLWTGATAGARSPPLAISQRNQLWCLRWCDWLLVASVGQYFTNFNTRKTLVKPIPEQCEKLVRSCWVKRHCWINNKLKMKHTMQQYLRLLHHTMVHQWMLAHRFVSWRERERETCKNGKVLKASPRPRSDTYPTVQLSDIQPAWAWYSELGATLQRAANRQPGPRPKDS